MRKAKTPLLAFLQKAFHIASVSRKPGAPPADELIQQAQEKVWTRRKFLEKGGKAALLTGLGGSLLAGCQKDDLLKTGGFDAEEIGAFAKKKNKNDVKIGIIGAGIAGLHALHILKQNGVNNVTVYEASNRVGGRIMTATGVMGTGLTTEFGGEFIDSIHDDMISLANEFGLDLLDMESPSETALIKDAYYFNGQLRTLAQVVAAFQDIAPQMEDDINSLSNNITYNNSSATDQYFDNLSISEYLDSISCNGWLKELLEVAYETEYGLSPEVQSSINLLFLISTDTTGGNFEIFGVSDERYKISGGNQQLVDLLGALYPNNIETNRALTALDINSNGEYKLFLTGYSNPKKVDYVILALPFTILRNVDIMFNLPAWKENAIQNLGYGTNSKLMLGYDNRPWRTLGYQGYAFADNGMQTGWDNSQLQPGNLGGYTVYLGGQAGLNVSNGTVASQANIYRPKINQIFPGSSSHQVQSKVARFHWPSFPWSLGSYACYTTGQWTSIAGAEKKKVGNLRFAGEHCSSDYQGYMNGGAEMGRKAAEKILDDL